MEKGDIVTIINHKLNGDAFIEGVAVLVRLDTLTDDGIPIWWIHFPGDAPGENYQRHIYSREDVERVRALQGLSV